MEANMAIGCKQRSRQSQPICGSHRPNSPRLILLLQPIRLIFNPSASNSPSSFLKFQPCIATAKPDVVCSNVSFSYHPAKYMVKDVRRQSPYTRKWEIHSAAQVESLVLSDEDKKTWEACRSALSVLSFSVEEQDKMLGKAFGHIHSPYWGEDRKKEVPNIETVNDILNYLRALGLSEEDLSKLLKKFPEVLGCNLEQELKTNVQLLDKQWGIQGKSLRSLLLRNPKVLGYNVDCKGDCIAKCTRCWVRF